MTTRRDLAMAFPAALKPGGGAEDDEGIARPDWLEAAAAAADTDWKIDGGGGLLERCCMGDERDLWPSHSARSC